MDFKLAELHKKIYNRSIVPWPPLIRPYVPDPVKWSRLNQMQKQAFITKSNQAIEYSLENTRLYPYTTRAELFANTVIPPGFDSVQDVLGAIARDKYQ